MPRLDVGSIIAGSAIAIPPRVVTNHDLEQIMDTTDDWIVSRTGVRQRHMADPGVGSSDLATDAVLAAVSNAGTTVDEIDLLVMATMTPDQFAPGPAPLVQDKAGLGHVAAFDIRQQCGGFLFGLDLADAYLSTGRARRAVVVGAEVHTGYLPYGDSGFARLRGGTGEVSSSDRAAATEARGWAVLFGDGAGAMVLEPNDDDDVGFIASRLHSDGSHFDLIQVVGAGFAHQPYIDAAQLEARMHWPQMNGLELFRQAVRRMPESVEEVLVDTALTVADIDVLIAHQANARILQGVQRQLGIAEKRVVNVIERFANTTAGTLPIAFHERRGSAGIDSGDLVAFTAFGAGAHWGAMLYRAP
ncbi:MAG: 3-oxoacyl-[acyl-carrier-protein] synthase III C-terminal domain-containing protein [Acidimicrobiales bacterium]